MVEMAQERSFQALADQRNTTKHVYNTSVPVAVFPVVIPDAGDRDVQHIHPYPEVEVRQMSLEASDAGQQPPVKRKRGRPRKIKPDEGGQAQGQSAGGPKEAPSSTIKGSRAKKTEQTGSSTTKPPTGDQGVVQQPVGAVKKRGRPRKVTAAQTDEGTSPAVERSRAATTVGYATGYTPTSVYSTVQDTSIVSAIQGAPVRILPTTTAVAAMNTIDDSSLRPTASVSVVIPSPTAEDTAKQSTRIPLSLSSLSTGEGSAAGKSFTYTLQGTTTPPLLHAEQPRVLKLLPQCIMTKSVVNVDLVDRWKEDNRTAGETSTDTRKKEPSGDEGKKGSENGEEGEEGRGRSKNEVGGEPVERRKRGPAKKPETMPEVQPQEQAPVKRKRGRPPKNKNAPQPSDASPSTTRKRPRKERISSSSGDHPETTEPTTEPQATEVATQVTETVVKRKRGRPLKNINTQTQTTESPLLAARLPNESVVDPTSATSGEERGSESIPKRGRTVKSSKVGVKTPEATQPAPVKRKRGRPRKYPIPVVAASGPFLPSVSGVTLPSDDNEDTTIVGEVHLLPNGKESGSEPAAARPAKNKRGRPPKKPQDEEEEPPVKRKRGRPRKNPLPAEGEETASPKRPQKQEEQRQQQVRKKPGRPRKQLLKNSPEVIQQKTKSPVAEKETDPLPKRKRGRPRKVPLVVTTVQEPASVSSADESSVSVNVVDNSEGDSTAVEKLTLQISFSDSDSEHSEKMEVQTSAIMALANRVASTPSPPRQLDSPLLDPSFEESYDEDSDPDTK